MIAACGSANVGASPVFSSTGGPSEMIATQPVPCSAMLNRPPPIMPAGALDLLMSQSMPASKASRFAPLHRDGVVLEVEQVDVLGGVGQEDLAGAGHLHQRRALAGHGLLEHAAHAAGAGVLEADTSPW